MKTALKHLPLVILPLLLGACQQPALTPVVGMTPSLVGGSITSTLTVTRDANGQPTSMSIVQNSVAPTLRVAISPASLGVTFTSIDVNIVDAAGTTYTRVYRQGFGERVPGGWACKTSANASSVELVLPLTDQCDVSLKVPYARTVDVAQLPILDGVTTTQIAQDFFAAYGTTNQCPDLSYNVVLNGFDDWHRAITPIVLRNQPISETCNVK